MALACCICKRSVPHELLVECQFTAFGEPCCSYQCHRDAYALDRFQQLELGIAPTHGELPFRGPIDYANL